MKPLRFVFATVVVSLLAAGCDDSKIPLSDPAKSPADARLAGVWRLENDDSTTFYHIGPLGKDFPASMMRGIIVTHSNEGQIGDPEQMLLFPTKIGDSSYLNVAAIDEPQLKLVQEKGWKAIDSYFILKYKIEEDTLLVWTIDGAEKRRAIESGKIKGVIESGNYLPRIRFTDTSENIAHFIAAEGDKLFTKDPIRMERVKLRAKRPQKSGTDSLFRTLESLFRS